MSLVAYPNYLQEMVVEQLTHLKDIHQQSRKLRAPDFHCLDIQCLVIGTKTNERHETPFGKLDRNTVDNVMTSFKKSESLIDQLFRLILKGSQ